MTEVNKDKGDISILLVEHEPVDRIVALKKLEFIGYNKVSVAEDGEQALSIYGEGKYDITISGGHMPKMDGLELTEKIKQGDPSAKIIINSADYRIGQEALDKGAYDFLRKPSSIEDFKQSIDNALSDGPKGIIYKKQK